MPAAGIDLYINIPSTSANNILMFSIISQKDEASKSLVGKENAGKIEEDVPLVYSFSYSF